MSRQKIDRRAVRIAGSMTALCLALGFTDSPCLAGDTAGLPRWLGRRPVQLWPRERDEKLKSSHPIKLGDWEYKSNKAAVLRDGVPWELVVTPAGPRANEWRKGAAMRAIPVLDEAGTAGRKSAKSADGVPIVEVPDTAWRGWLASDLQDVVGIHYHAMVTDDVARILYTLHRASPDGRHLKDDDDATATRIEATLLTPVVYHLDQTILVRKDQHHPALAASRAEHEAGHAKVSQQVFLAVLHGPQDWNPRTAIGRRSRMEYYWKREQIGRAWNGYRDGVAQLATLRTTVALVPPTRWSLLLPVPPERVTQQHLQAFNDAIVHLGATFEKADRTAQDQFHSHHGEFEAAARP
jgi:hypothetical protein